jgi:hypothetical protein
MSFLQNVKRVLSIKLHKCDDLHKDWICLDTDKYAAFNSYISVNNMWCLQHVVFPGGMSSVMITWAVAAYRTGNREMNVSLKQSRVLPKLMLLTQPLNYHFTHIALVSMTNRTF